MSKRRKGGNPHIPTLYTKRAFEKDIGIGIQTYAGAIGVVVKNTKIIEAVKVKVETSTSINEEQRNDYMEAISLLLSHTHSTLDTLEQVERDYINKTPQHFPRDSTNVNKWVMDIQMSMINACEWITELTPVYQMIIDGLQLSDEMALTNPAPKKEEE